MTKLLMGLFVAVSLSLPSGLAAQDAGQEIAAGARVYAATCGRCHQARPGSERTDREWAPIVAHMRARANLTKSQAANVLAFLRATNAPEPGTSAAGVARGVVPPPSLRLSLAMIHAPVDAR